MTINRAVSRETLVPAVALFHSLSDATRLAIVQQLPATVTSRRCGLQMVVRAELQLAGTCWTYHHTASQ